MLAHSPPLPLIIDYSYRNRDITAEDEEGIILHSSSAIASAASAFGCLPNLQKLIMAIDEEYPVLEYLIMDLRRGTRVRP
jgi:hypothetical protein